MSEGYYDPYPRLSLDRPLVLVGHPASGVDQIGRMIAGRTGLPFNDVERATESVAGRSRSKILLEDGIEALRELEADALANALRRSPFGVVVMESGLLESEARRSWLQERSAIVHVHRPFAILLALIQRRVGATPGSLPEFMMGAPEQVDELQEHLAQRELALAEIGVVFDAMDRHPSWVAGQLLESLDDLLGVDRFSTTAHRAQPSGL